MFWLFFPISRRVDGTSASKVIDGGSIPGRVKPKIKEIEFTAFLLDVQQQKG